MSVIKVFTDDGVEVASFDVPDVYQGNAVWGRLTGHLDEPSGWLGRALRDARIIQREGDPERPSEKAIRILAEPRGLNLLDFTTHMHLMEEWNDSSEFVWEPATVLYGHPHSTVVHPHTCDGRLGIFVAVYQTSDKDTLRVSNLISLRAYTDKEVGRHDYVGPIGTGCRQRPARRLS
jgi:hypothetical protein